MPQIRPFLTAEESELQSFSTSKSHVCILRYGVRAHHLFTYHWSTDRDRGVCGPRRRNRGHTRNSFSFSFSVSSVACKHCAVNKEWPFDRHATVNILKSHCSIYIAAIQRRVVQRTTTTTTTTMRVMPEGAKTCMTRSTGGSLESDNVDFHTLGR